MTDRRAVLMPAVAIPSLLIAAQLAVRALLVARGDFYWDDLILIGEASAHPIWSWSYLGLSHDGHFMPAAFLLAGLTTLAAPVQWFLPAVTLVVLQLIASLAVWRMIRVVAPSGGPLALVALAFYLFVPMTVPSYTWWAAGLNTLPLQAGMAVVVANAVLLTRGVAPQRRPRLLLGAVVALLVALAFFEKSLYIVPVAFVASWLVLALGDDRRGWVVWSPVRLWRSAGSLWAWLWGITAVWAVVFVLVSTATVGAHSIGQTWQLTWRSVTDAIVPSMVGGPWEWTRWTPSPPMGFPSTTMIAAGWVLIAVALWWSWTTKQRTLPIWGAAALYAVAAQLPVMWNRSSDTTALELAQTMRYLPDTALVIALALALVAAAPDRGDRQRQGSRSQGRHRARTSDRLPQAVLAAGTVLFTVSSLVSTSSFSASWNDDPTGAYLATARASLAEHRDLVMFDQSLPLEVLTPVAYPNNQISRVFGRLRERPRFGTYTDRLMVLDETGAMVPGGVSKAREFAALPGGCDRPALADETSLPLSGPLIEFGWTVGFSYCANRDGRLAVGLGGDEVEVPVQAGLHAMYVQLDGGGDRITLRPLTPGLALHTGPGRVGEPIVAAYEP